MPKKTINHQIGQYEDVLKYCQDIIDVVKK